MATILVIEKKKTTKKYLGVETKLHYAKKKKNIEKNWNIQKWMPSCIDIILICLIILKEIVTCQAQTLFHCGTKKALFISFFHTENLSWLHGDVVSVLLKIQNAQSMQFQLNTCSFFKYLIFAFTNFILICKWNWLL